VSVSWNAAFTQYKSAYRQQRDYYILDARLQLLTLLSGVKQQRIESRDIVPVADRRRSVLHCVTHVMPLLLLLLSYISPTRLAATAGDNAKRSRRPRLIITRSSTARLRDETTTTFGVRRSAALQGR